MVIVVNFKSLKIKVNLFFISSSSDLAIGRKDQNFSPSFPMCRAQKDLISFSRLVGREGKLDLNDRTLMKTVQSITIHSKQKYVYNASKLHLFDRRNYFPKKRIIGLH